MEFCPVCMLREALPGGVQSGESAASEDTVKPRPKGADGGAGAFASVGMTLTAICAHFVLPWLPRLI